jgi:hypothetical protein
VHLQQAAVEVHKDGKIPSDDRCVLLEEGAPAMEPAWLLTAAHHLAEEQHAEEDDSLCANRTKVSVRHFHLKFGSDTTHCGIGGVAGVGAGLFLKDYALRAVPGDCLGGARG